MKSFHRMDLILFKKKTNRKIKKKERKKEENSSSSSSPQYILTITQVYTIKMMENEQKQPWFLDINPNGRLPAITDTLPNGDKIRVFESGAILEYLVERYDKDHKISYPRGSAEYWEVTSWVFPLPPPL